MNDPKKRKKIKFWRVERVGSREVGGGDVQKED